MSDRDRQSQNQSQNQSPNPAQGYANRAAIKATGAFARLGKALYGLNDFSNQTGTAAPSSTLSSTLSSSPAGNPVPTTTNDASFSYKTRNGIVAMAASPSSDHAALVGKDFFKVVSVHNTNVSLEMDLRDVRRDLDRIYLPTALKWGSIGAKQHIALGHSGGGILLYGLDDKRVQYGDATRTVNSLAFSGLQSTLLSGNADGSITAWDMRDGSFNRSSRRGAGFGQSVPTYTMTRNGDSVREIQCSPFDSRKIVAIYDSGVIQRWDLRNTSHFDRRMNAHAGVGLCVDWHPEQDYIVSGGRDQQIQVWNMAKDTKVPDCVIQAPSSVGRVRWLAGDESDNNIYTSKIASCGRNRGDNMLYVWTLERPYVPINVIEAHSDTISEVHYKGGGFLWSASRDKTFKQTDLRTQPVYVDELCPIAMTWSPDSDLAVAEQDARRQDFVSIYNKDQTVQQQVLHIGQNIPGVNQKVHHSLSSSSLAGFYTGGAGASYGSSAGAGAIGGEARKLLMSQSNPGYHERDLSMPASLSGLRTHSNGSLTHAPGVIERGGDATSAIIFDVNFSTNDKDVFKFLAGKYMVTRDLSQIPAVCGHNAEVSLHMQRYRTAQIWRILEEAVTADLTYACERGFLFTEPGSQDRQFDHSISSAGQSGRVPKSTGEQRTAKVSENKPPDSKLAKGLKASSRADSNQNENWRDQSKEGAAPVQESNMKTCTDSIGGGALGFKSAANNTATSTDPVNIPQASNNPGQAQQQNAQLANEISSPDDDDDESYGKHPEGASYTHITMLSSSHPKHHRSMSAVSASFNRNGSMDNSWKARSVLEDIREQSGSGSWGDTNVFQSGQSAHYKDNVFMRRDTLSSAVSSDIGRPHSQLIGNQRDSIVITEEGTDVDDQSDHEMASSEPSMGNQGNGFAKLLQGRVSGKPWNTEELLRQAGHFAQMQGDLQFCGTLAMMFLEHYPGMCTSLMQGEEWVMSYIELLRRHKLFTPAANIIKLATRFPNVRTMGLTNTNVDIVCPACRSVLSEFENPASGKPPGYWYCPNCKSRTGKCSICLEPLKKLGVMILKCRHETHTSCMREWVFSEQMDMCPACGKELD